MNEEAVEEKDNEELFWDKSKSRAGQWDMGHTQQNKYSKWHKDYLDGKKYKKRVFRMV